MKTAMQDMICFLNKAIEMCHDKYEEKINFAWIKFHAELLLEKEKEQMFEFANKYVDYVMGGTEYSAKEYYYDKYNQNK